MTLLRPQIRQASKQGRLAMAQAGGGVVQCIAVQHAYLDKQATIIQGPNDSIHRAAAQRKAEGVAGPPMHTDCILGACKVANLCDKL